MPQNGFAERAIRTPPDMQRRMDLFRERINMHRVPTDQTISPSEVHCFSYSILYASELIDAIVFFSALIPTQDFLINTTKKAIRK